MRLIIYHLICTLMVLFLSDASHAKVEAILGLPLAKNPNALSQLPMTGEPEILLSRTEYLVSYNKNTRLPNWSAWQVDETLLGGTDRTGVFSNDPVLEE